MSNILKALIELEKDAVLWKAKRIWGEDPDPDDMVSGIESLTEMLVCIVSEIKRNEYITIIQKELHIRDKMLSKSVKKAVDLLEKKRQEALQKAKYKNDKATKEQYGIDEDAEGDIFDILKYGIYIKNGVYYTTMGSMKGQPISNFTMKISYHAETGDERAYRLITLKNEYGFEKTINMNTDDFSSIGSFKKEIARRGNFSFRGNDADLSRLAEMLQKDEITAKAITTLGYQKRDKFWAWANGIVTVDGEDAENKFMPVDEYGIVTYNNKNYFMEYCSKMHADHEDKFSNEKKFIHIDKEDNGIGLNKWMELFYRSYNEKAIPGVLFYISSLFSDLVFGEIDCFPILSLIGPPGAGKGKMAESIMSLFGDRQKAIMLGGQTTATGFMRKFAQIRNGVVWLDEFKNNINPKMIESIKNIYDRTGYERGMKTNDYQTNSTPVLSSCILSGQEMPTGEAALFMRTIQILFQEGKFTEKQRAEFEQFKQMEKNGFSYLTSEIFSHRDIVQKNYRKVYKTVKDRVFKENSNKSVDDRFIVNISVLLAIYVIFENTFKFPFSYQTAQEALLKNMIEQHKILAGNNEMGKFWGVVEALFHSEQIFENRDFVLEDGILYLSLISIHPLYVKEMRARGDSSYLPKPTLEHYLKLDTNIHKGNKRKRFPNGTSPHCHLIQYNQLGIDLIRVKAGTLEKSAEQRNKEMGVNLDEDGKDQVPDDLPF